MTQGLPAARVIPRAGRAGGGIGMDFPGFLPSRSLNQQRGWSSDASGFGLGGCQRYFSWLEPCVRQSRGNQAMTALSQCPSIPVRGFPEMSVDHQHSWKNTNTASPSSSLLGFPKLTPSNIAVCSSSSTGTKISTSTSTGTSTSTSTSTSTAALLITTEQAAQPAPVQQGCVPVWHQ